MIEDKENNTTYIVGDFIFEVGEKCLLRGAERINLTPKNFELLLMLVENKGKLLEKQFLLSAIWKDTVVEEGNLTRTISSLRKTLGDTKEENFYIQTIPRIGYRFIADVERADFDVQDQTRSDDKKTDEKRILSWPIGLLVGVILVGILSGLAVFYWRSKEVANVPSSTDQQIQPQRLTTTPQNEQVIGWTGDGRLRFVRWINNNLAESWVMNADGSNSFKENKIDALQLGVWSPNGNKVVFSKQSELPNKLNYMADADGTNEIKLPVKAENVSWSSDGQNFVFQAVPATAKNPEDFEIYLYQIGSGKLQQITDSEGFDGDAAFSPDGREIVFVSVRDGDFEIYLMNVNGKNVRRLTKNSAHDSFPRFTSDGTGLTFSSNIDGETTDLYFMRTDGRDLTRLTSWNSNELSRANCSPDGTKIAFNSDKDGNDEIYIMDLEPKKAELLIADKDASLQTPSLSKDGKKLVYSAELPDKTGELRILDLATQKSEMILKTDSGSNYPRFSPDGSKIVFHQEVNGRWDIFTIDANGSGLKNLTVNTASDSIANWMPDGKQIIFRSNRNGESRLSGLYSMNADGTDQKPILTIQGSLGWSYISPDGREIIYSCDRQTKAGMLLDICLAKSDGSDEKILLSRPDNDMQPVFSPDGNKIAFVASSDGNPEIYLMNKDGSNLFRLTRNPAKDLNPIFSADGKKIIFSSDRRERFSLYQVSIENIEH